uniref:Uncharacterized protein n=1 Tax=Ditylenchus dipsaci TaxID=166011 RepID=A0A915DQP1_9BILA
MNNLYHGIFLLIVSTLLLVSNVNCQQKPTGGLEPAVRVARFRIDYPKADLTQINKLPNWPIVMRKSVLASLNKTANDCGKLQVTGRLSKKTTIESMLLLLQIEIQ